MPQEQKWECPQCHHVYNHQGTCPFCLKQLQPKAS